MHFRKTQSLFLNLFMVTCHSPTIREGEYPFMNISRSRRMLHLLIAGADASIADIIPNGIIKQHCVLRHHPDVGAKRGLQNLREEPVKEWELVNKTVWHTSVPGIPEKGMLQHFNHCAPDAGWLGRMVKPREHYSLYMASGYWLTKEMDSSLLHFAHFWRLRARFSAAA